MVSVKRESLLTRNFKPETLSDEELVNCARNGNNEAMRYLLNKYQYLVHVKARSYFLEGAEHEDTVQEGMIGLYKAIRDYRGDCLCSFRSFAVLCITRQIITAVKTYTRKKHNPLSCYRPIENYIYDESGETSLNNNAQITSKNEDPLELFIQKDEIERIFEVMREKLSPLEWRVWMSHLEGKSYREIAVELDRDTKVVDNALCRIKLKIRDYIEPELN